MKQKNRKYLVGIGTALLIAGMFAIALNLIKQAFGASIISVAIILIIIGVFRQARKKQMPDKDERVKKIGAYALSYSWITTLITMTVLFWINYFQVLKIPTEAFFEIIFFVMVLSANIFQYWLLKKGDIE